MLPTPNKCGGWGEIIIKGWWIVDEVARDLMASTATRNGEKQEQSKAKCYYKHAKHAHTIDCIQISTSANRE